MNKNKVVVREVIVNEVGQLFELTGGLIEIEGLEPWVVAAQHPTERERTIWLTEFIELESEPGPDRAPDA